jgi:hypothetical protein
VYSLETLFVSGMYECTNTLHKRDNDDDDDDDDNNNSELQKTAILGTAHILRKVPT